MLHAPIADHMLKNYDGVLKIDGEWATRRNTIRDLYEAREAPWLRR